MSLGMGRCMRICNIILPAVLGCAGCTVHRSYYTYGYVYSLDILAGVGLVGCIRVGYLYYAYPPHEKTCFAYLLAFANILSPLSKHYRIIFLSHFSAYFVNSRIETHQKQLPGNKDRL